MRLPRTNRSVSRQVVDRTCHRGGPEPIVDVDDGHTGSAAIEHPEQGRETSETGAIPDTRWHRDNRGTDESPDHARECTLHPGNRDDHLRVVETLLLGQQPMEASDADIMERLDMVTKELGTDPGFLGDREIRCSCCRNDDDPAATGRSTVRTGDGPSRRMELRIGYHVANSRICGLVGASYEQWVSRCDQALRNGSKLRRRLASSEHDLREPLTHGAVMIDARETEVLEWRPTQHVYQLRLCLRDRERAPLDLLEDGSNLLVVHSKVFAKPGRSELTCLPVGCTVNATVPRIDPLSIPSPQSLLLGLYFTILVCLSIYGVHRCYLVYLYTKYRRSVPTRRYSSDTADAPFVTVQLPIYNEMYVVDRLIDAVANLSHPRDRLEIQVLDDSIDETRHVAKQAVARWASRGVNIRYFHRAVRTGYKAGALADGLRTAAGEFIAIFDADFVPSEDFLTQALPAFRDLDVGMVQARWGHVNRDYSLLTQVEALLLDAHFVLEHGARSRGRCFFNFNGTAGIWRRQAIDAAGGWRHDTLTEDLDLSYRAQLAGWRFVFLPEVVAPAEVPVEMNSFKIQQHRWAKGSIQTCLKVLPAVLRADLPVRVKVEAFFHLTANFNYPLMLTLAIVMVPALFVRSAMSGQSLLLVDVPLFCAATLSVVNFYALSQRLIRSDWLAQLRYIPAVLAVGIGLSVNNTKAVLGALSGRHSHFMRTPKYGIIGKHDEWMGKRYRQSVIRQPLVELGLGLYYTGAMLYAASVGLLAPLPLLGLFQFGFLYMGLLSLVQQNGSADFTLSAQVAGD